MNEVYNGDSGMPAYLIFPRALLKMGLNATETAVYMLLLDRARLSAQHPAWRDENGQVYQYYPIRALCEALDRGESAVKEALLRLEQKDLISRRRTGREKPNRLYVKLPPEEQPARAGSRQVPPEAGEREKADTPESDRRKTGCSERRGSDRHDRRKYGCRTAGNPTPNKNYRAKTKELSAASGPTLAEYNRMQRLLKRLEEASEEGRQAPPLTPPPPGPSPGRPPSYP